jgi:succinoglycan biosynthesis transport protein ExoP
MTSGGHSAHAATLRDYLRVVRRRKWIILQAVVLVPAAAVVFSLHQEKLYQASAQVLLSSQNLAAQLTGTQSTGINLQPDRIAQTQADVARVPELAQRVLQRVRGTYLTPQSFLDSSGVSTATNADILTFTVTNHSPWLARRLVDAYARAYTVYRRELDTASIHRALIGVNQRLQQLSKVGSTHSALYNSLAERQQTLLTMEALQTSNASVVKQADRVVQTQPKPVRNGILGFLLGAVLGVGLAFLWEALDTRVRNAQELGERLGGLPLLARIPAPDKKFKARNKLVMLEDPNGVHAETFRMLRTNLDFALLNRDVQTIMVTSAVQQEGKSTTIANLAVALARAGKRVVLVDLDLRRPFLDRFFHIDGPGITQVALKHASLNQALKTIAIMDVPRGRRNGNGNGNGHGAIKGVLQVLPAGPIPPDPGEFVATNALGGILEELRDGFDVVLIDAPPALAVGDAMTLSAKVDGLIVVTRVKTVRRQMMTELARLLGTVPADVLGFVLTGADSEEGHGEGGGYGYGYGYGRYYGRAYQQSEKARRARSEA